MAEQKMITIINQRPGKVVLRDKRVLQSGASASVSVEEAKGLLSMPGIVDAAKAVPQQADENEALRAENAKLKADLAKARGGKKSDKADKPELKPKDDKGAAQGKGAEPKP